MSSGTSELDAIGVTSDRRASASYSSKGTIMRTSKLMWSFAFATAIMTSAALTALPALANTFNFSITDASGDSANGTFITGATGAPYTITGISGVWDGQAITGLSPYASADQLLWPGVAPPPNADFSGISFEVASLGLDVNWSNYGGIGLGALALSTIDPGGFGCCQIALTSASVTETPLPSTWPMLISGLVGLGFFAYRGTKKSSVRLAAA
jgi:hypothetical protein